MKRFENQVVMITGASSGIGEALAYEFSREGAHVVLCARRLDRLEALARELSAQGPRAIAAAADVQSREQLDAAVAVAMREFGRLDVLVANAGFGVVGQFERLKVEDYRFQFETNVFGLINSVYAALPEIKRRRGGIALLGSVAGHIALPGNSPYSMSKFAVRALASSMDGELRPQGVAVTLISPGFVASNIRRVANDGTLHEKATEPLPKWLVMETGKAAREIVGAIAARKHEQIVTFHGKAAVFLYRHFPWLLQLGQKFGLRSRREPGAAR